MRRACEPGDERRSHLPPLEPPTRAPPGRDAGHVSVDEDEELAVPDNKAIDWLVVGAPSHMRG